MRCWWIMLLMLPWKKYWFFLFFYFLFFEMSISDFGLLMLSGVMAVNGSILTVACIFKWLSAKVLVFFLFFLYHLEMVVLSENCSPKNTLINSENICPNISSWDDPVQLKGCLSATNCIGAHTVWPSFQLSIKESINLLPCVQRSVVKSAGRICF